MYDKLIKRLRECTAEQNGEKTLWHQAADAIEELSKALEAVNDAHNEGYDVGYWAGRRDYEPEWIPVTERLPEDDGEVLCINDYHFYIVGWLYCDDVGNYICESDNEIMYDVTHWMPLPQPPKDGES